MDIFAENWTVRPCFGKEGRFEIRPAEGQGASIGYAPLAYVQGDKRMVGDDAATIANAMAASPSLARALREIAERPDDAATIARAVLRDVGLA